MVSCSVTGSCVSFFNRLCTSSRSKVGIIAIYMTIIIVNASSSFDIIIAVARTHVLYSCMEIDASGKRWVPIRKGYYKC